MMNALALFGGTKALPKTIQEKWERPKEREKELISAMIDRGELSGDGFGIGKEFEEAFKKYIGCQYALSFSHGTAALFAAYYAAGVGPGDEIITPVVGYIGSYAGALHMGARPIFADIDQETLLINPIDIEKKIMDKTKAINIIHLQGRVCDLDSILHICQKHKLALIDDASHAHGAEWNQIRLGNSDHVTCFSLQGVNPEGKPVAAGEGGIACTNSQEQYQRMLAFCHLHRKNINQELERSSLDFLDKEVLGLKWRAHPLAMGLALISLQSLEERNRKKRESYQKILECINPFPFVRAPKIFEKAKLGGFFNGIQLVYESHLLNDMPSQVFLAALAAEGIPLKMGLGPLQYAHEIFAQGFDLWGNGRGPILGKWSGLDEYQKCKPLDFPNAERLREKTFSVPCFIEVDEYYYIALKEALSKIQAHVLAKNK